MSFFRYPERKFDPCPAGMHQAVCVDAVDMGDVAGQYGIKPKYRIVFQIAEVNPATGRRFDVAAFYTNSMHKKAKLRIDLSSWAGRPLTEEECKAFDPERLIGKNCLILVVQAAGEDGTIYANIKAVAPLKGAARLTPLDYVRAKDRPGYTPPAKVGIVAPVTTPIVHEPNSPMPSSNVAVVADEDIEFAFGENVPESNDEL